MTEPDDFEDTRPISVRELLARNGTIGSPPVGGRRRRRRGNTEAVTVAELTGEIPIVQHEASMTNGATDTVAEPDAEYEPSETEPAARGDAAPSEVPAEEMRPDAVDDDDVDAAIAVAEDGPEPAESLVAEAPVDEPDEPDEPVEVDDKELPAYLRATPEPLFGGRSDTDRLVRDHPTDRGTAVPEVPPATTSAEDHEDSELPTRMQQLMRGALIVLQSILAVAFGAGLFIAFEQLWKWNGKVALGLSVLVILGLVAAVRIVRKTEDMASTLTAVAVGFLVTCGPLALLQSH